MKINTAATIVAAAAGLSLAAPAAAVITTYAQYQQVQGSQKLIRYARVGSGNGTGNRIHSTTTASSTALGASAVNFQFTIPTPPELSGSLAARMTLDASTTQKISAASNLTGSARTQSGFNGFVEFRLVSPVMWQGSSKDLLLRLDFTNAMISTTQNSTQLNFGGSNGGGTTITASSDFLNYGNVMLHDFGYSVVALNPAFLGNNNTYGRTVRGSATGNFSSDPAPFILVPEPATWAMMIAGFGLVGASLRRRSAAGRVIA